MTSKLANAVRDKLSLEYQPTPILNAICESIDERLAPLEEKLSDHPAAFLLEESSRTIVPDFVDDVKVCDEIEALSIELLSIAKFLREAISNGRGWVRGGIGALEYNFEKFSVLVRESSRRANEEERLASKEREKSNGENQS